MSQAETMRKVVSETKRVVNGVRPDQLSNATPCSEWDVRAVLNHITAGGTMFAECVEHGSISDEEMGRLMSTDLLGDDYKSAFATAADRAVAAFDAPGVEEKLVTLPFGEMPAGVALGIAVFDLTTHALDLAQATGQSKDLDPEVLEAAWNNAHGMLNPELRGSGMFGPEHDVPADAPLAERLMAFTGRTI